jgi:arabinan endo-1,5-alpha-L-arabinosidase
MPAPAAQPGDKTDYQPRFAQPALPKNLVPAFSDEFNSATLNNKWQWVRPPAAGTFGLAGGTFNFDTQAADLYVDSNNASVLTEKAPGGEYIVETKVKLNVPAAGCCFNYVQAGMVIYKDDDNFIKLADVSIWETRQTEFAKELSPVPAGYPRYGNTVVGPPGDWAYLRIVKTFGWQGGRDGSGTHAGSKEEVYTPYTSRDGITWVKGGAWTHQLGDNVKIGLISMGGSGFMANFDYVRVYRLNRGGGGGR